MTKMIPIVDIRKWAQENLDGVIEKETYREKTFFYNPDGSRKNGIYIFTIKTCDTENDRSSYLDRPEVYRLSWQLTPEVFRHKFGPPPSRPAKGYSIETSFDFTQLNLHMPHAIYGWMRWSMILCPTYTSFDDLKSTIFSSYLLAQKKF